MKKTAVVLMALGLVCSMAVGCTGQTKSSVSETTAESADAETTAQSQDITIKSQETT